VYWDLTRTVKERFDQGGVSIPFPQRDIHIINAQPDSNAAGGATAAGRQQTPGAAAAGGNTILDGDDV